MGLEKYNKPSTSISTTNLTLNILIEFPNFSAPVKNVSENKRSMYERLRSFFESSNVLVVRPAKKSSLNMGAVFKGGSNGEEHNHNDVGSYTIVVNDKNICGDPGSIPYTANIFKKEFRYTYKTIGSYGHPVPLVAGKEQITGKEAKAELISKNFSDNIDEMVIDISSAYDEPTLDKLERIFVYDRTGKGSIIITDYFAFSTDNKFETAIVTHGEWKQLDANTIRLKMGKEYLYIKFTGSEPLVLKHETINEGGGAYTRLGIKLNKKVKEGSITMEFSPAK